jgi:hypothetical protein
MTTCCDDRSFLQKIFGFHKKAQGLPREVSDAREALLQLQDDLNRERKEIEHKKALLEKDKCKATRASYTIDISFVDCTGTEVTREFSGLSVPCHTFISCWDAKVFYHHHVAKDLALDDLRQIKAQLITEGITNGDTVYMPHVIRSVTFNEITTWNEGED